MQAAVIIVASVVVFWPALHGDWLWDDDVDITGNPITQSPGGLWNIWFNPGTQIDYYPIKASVQWIQWHLWGNDTFGYHLTNLVLHIVSALLVWRLFHRLGLKLAWLGGLIFAVHPALVESVAWIAELKNTLSMPFFLLSAIFYLEYEEHKRWNDYLWSLGWFLAAMLTKPTMVMFPAVILLYLWWKRGRVGKDDLETTVPFFAVSFVLGVVTLIMSSWHKYLHHQTPEMIPLGGVSSRLALTGLTLAFYFAKAVWPAGFLPIYPQWPVNPPTLLQFLPWPVLGGLLFWFWRKRQSWGRHALFGFGFFLLMLLPFSGLVRISFMYTTWVMDHFLYIPILGLIGLVLAGLEQANRRMPPPARHAGIGLIAVILAAMIVDSRVCAEQFTGSEVLWTYTLKYYPNARIAHNNLGNAFLDKKDIDGAIAEYQKAIAIDSDFALARNNLGGVLAQKGRVDEAIAQYQKALAIDPNYAEAHNNFGDSLVQKHQLSAAIDQYRTAVAINPEFAQARYNLGSTLAQAGQMDEAIEQYQKALEINPDVAEIHNNLGNTYFQKNDMEDALAQYREALRIKPDFDNARNNLGNVLLQMGRLDDAIAEYQKVLETNPGYVETHSNLGVALIRKGQMQEALAQFQEAVRLNPANPQAQNNLARLEETLRQNPGQK